uniref:Cytosolic carboxypeptidase N-terminal domain-containing protein n=1 Tax=Salvator merianae TaxID=96440 RepID=A0A8D0DYL2_SALMN
SLERSDTWAEANFPKISSQRNLSKYTAFPPGYFGQPKKGHLIFDACFESGNLGRVDHITEFEYDLFIRPDTCNPRFRVWFNFTVENVKESQPHFRVNVCDVFIRKRYPKIHINLIVSSLLE